MTDDDVPGKLTAEVLVAYLRRNIVAASDLPGLVRELRAAFGGDASDLCPAVAQDRRARMSDSGERTPPGDETLSAKAGTPTPAVPIAQSVTDDYLVSLEDGKHYRSLKRHLKAKHGLTPDEYRKKWGLPPDYPMVAPSYARDRSEVARRSGLGHATPINRASRSAGA